MTLERRLALAIGHTLTTKLTDTSFVFSKTREDMKSIRRAKSLQLHEHSRDFEGLVVSDRDFQPLLKQKQCLSRGWLGWATRVRLECDLNRPGQSASFSWREFGLEPQTSTCTQAKLDPRIGWRPHEASPIVQVKRNDVFGFNDTNWPVSNCSVKTASPIWRF